MLRLCSSPGCRSCPLVFESESTSDQCSVCQDSHSGRTMEAGVLFIIALILLTGLCSGQAVLPPGPVNGAVGGSVTLNTSISSEGPIQTIFWNFDDGSGSGSVPVITVSSGTTIDGPGYEGRVSVSSFTGSLELRELTLGDTGLYLMSMITSKPESGSTTLNVYEPVSNVTVSANATDLVELNDTVSLTCSASGTSLSYQWQRISGTLITGPSEPLIAGNSSANLSCQAAAGTSISREWLKDDQPLFPSNRITFTVDNSTVSISPVESSDNGEYQCRLSNPVSTDTANYTLTVNCE
ncbi:hypothetical protein JZ751_028287 [Albula glossodonta]|uniref:Ig-like domain-containing protein n=1 Tax=Albula glossodonta TaxID=121402 RepID=A0A8T2MR19_9TELE|nr:hypothetical protein JZ751_028287 [Albula glossodonta]